jgi:hypothetical protein
MHEVREAEGDRVTDQFTAYTHTVLGGEKLAEHKLNTQPQNHKCKPVSRYPPVSSVFSIRIRKREKACAVRVERWRQRRVDSLHPQENLAPSAEHDVPQLLELEETVM